MKDSLRTTISNVIKTTDFTILEFMSYKKDGSILFDYYVEYPDSADLYYKFGIKAEDRFSPKHHLDMINMIRNGYFDKEG